MGNRQITGDSLVVRSCEPLVAVVDNEVVLLSVARGQYYGLDEIGSEVWNRIASPTHISQLCAALGEAFDADAETIGRDVLSFLNRLAEYELIEVTS
jgi:hypothetical protein